MKHNILYRLLLAAALLALTACNTDIFSEEIPGFPQFKASTDIVDFSRVELQMQAQQSVTIRNLGARDSKLYLYYYLEGDQAFQLLTPEQEVMLRGNGSAYVIDIRFEPYRGGGCFGNLVLFSSDRPLKDDINVTTHRIRLQGWGGTSCNFPDVVIPPLMETSEENPAGN